MPRKILLSFLGISSYEPVRYYPEATGPEPKYAAEKYVQKALLDHLASEFEPNDAAYIFLTDLARQNNWTAKEGQVRLEPLVRNAYPFPVHDRSVRDESNNESIWETFFTVYNCLEDGDTVYLDITHSWRYLPMLGATLLNYAKALKNIKVGAIYYGALERLAPLHKVKEIPETERWTPILNLAQFSELQDWAAAAYDFVQYGNPQRWNALAEAPIAAIAKESKGTNRSAHNLKKINQHMQSLHLLLNTNRGGDLYKFPHQRFQEALATFSADDNFLKPLNAIVEQVRKKVEIFKADDPLRWLKAVEWCIQHGLIQQGITQLQEGLLTWLCDYFEGKSLEPDYFRWNVQKPRDLLSEALHIAQKGTPEEEWTREARERKALTRNVLGFAIIGQLASIYTQLTQLRNDINHGGYTGNLAAASFEKRLRQHFEEISNILESNKTLFQSQGTGLLNLSNHPSSSWGQDQLQAAMAQYGTVEDLPFPAIPPDADAGQVQQLAQEYFEQVMARRPAAVHLMGEMTFTYMLLNLLREAGIPCVASATERIVLEETDGRKVSTFKFAQFRPYF